MHSSPIEILADASARVAARVAVAAEVRRLLETERPLGDAWRTVCGVASDERAPAEVRRAAVRAMAGAPAAAPNQLVRVFTGDDDRSVRKEAVAVLRALGVAPSSETRLAAQLAAARGPNRALTLANLALSFGHDPRIVAVYDEALRDPDEAVRGLAVRGLAMLGEMAQVVAALDDPAPAVRARAVEDLGFYFTGDDAEAHALDRALGDADATVRNAAIVALRRIGRRPLAAIAATRAPAPSGGDPFGWCPILEELSRRGLADRTYAVTLDDEVVASGWLGHPGATPAAIATLEERLGAKLPPSYAAFLRVSDGFRRLAPTVGALLPAARVRRFADENAGWLAACSIPADAVQISEVFDGAVLLLVPAADALDGEWEAWLLASWLGTRRHRSFLDLMRPATP